MIRHYGAAAILFPLLSAFFDAPESVGDSLTVDAEAGAGIGSLDYMRLWAVTYLLACVPLFFHSVLPPFPKGKAEQGAVRLHCGYHRRFGAVWYRGMPERLTP